METIQIARVTEDEIYSLQDIGCRTFYETFSDTNTEENMQQYLQESFEVSKLLAELRNVNSRFYFAKFDGNIIGYLKLNTADAQTESVMPDALEIERIYVAKEFHGKKVGQLLYDKAIEVAQELGQKSIWLGVWEENARAIQFYKKNGFIEFDRHIFRMGDDEQTDLMMKKMLD